MPVYTVHEPPLRAHEALPNPLRFVFVRDGFYFSAFVVAVLWMLWHRMWLVLLIYIVVALGLDYGMYYAGIDATAISLVQLFLVLLIGIEAATLRRFTLKRRGWKNIAVVSGANLEDAERRFFSGWVRSAPGKSAGSTAASPEPSVSPHTSPATDIIGLFPEPGASR